MKGDLLCERRSSSAFIDTRARAKAPKLRHAAAQGPRRTGIRSFAPGRGRRLTVADGKAAGACVTYGAFSLVACALRIPGGGQQQVSLVAVAPCGPRGCLRAPQRCAVQTSQAASPVGNELTWRARRRLSAEAKARIVGLYKELCEANRVRWGCRASFGMGRRCRYTCEKAPHGAWFAAMPALVAPVGAFRYRNPRPVIARADPLKQAGHKKTPPVGRQ
jgi:hypothetical protein